MVRLFLKKNLITASGLLSHAKVVSGPLCIISGESNGRILATVKLDITDTHSGNNLKALVNRPVFINGKSCRTLPWVNKTSVPQCASCQQWGHSTGGCLSNTTYCAICPDAHLTSCCLPKGYFLSTLLSPLASIVWQLV